MSVQRRLHTRQACSVTHRYTDRPTRTHAKHANTCSLCTSINTNGRLGRMCGTDHIFPPPFLAVRRVSVSRVSRGSKTRREEGPKQRKQIRRWLKTTDGDERKRDGFSGNWMRDLGEEGGRTVV